MAIGLNVLCGMAGIGAIALAALQVPSAQSAVKAPPGVEPGVTVTLDWDGKGLTTGEVRQVEGDWVKLRVVKEQEKQGDNTLTVMGGYEVWVNFDRLTYYRAPRKK